jgi:hypothetical protein
MDRFLIDFSILDSERAAECEALPLVHQVKPTVEPLSASVGGVGGETLPLTVLEEQYTPGADTRSQILPADGAGVGEEGPSLVTSLASANNH